ncbi:MAG TPA: D-alanyl-D-alanine carboxypeptidase family protein [Thermoleophilia bacterium]|nr:D-alanyl-D-alanine carboxypeptidase family protein [Thermoleophilia bacterium]
MGPEALGQIAGVLSSDAILGDVKTPLSPHSPIDDARRARPARLRLGRGSRTALILGVAAGVLALVPACGGLAQSAAAPARPATSSAGLPAARGPAPQVHAWSGILVDSSSGAVLWAKSPDRRLEPASCAKIMTALLVLEHFRNLDAYVRVPSEAYPRKVSIGLRPGDRITVAEALRAMMVHSANDATITLAHAVAGSERRFTALMNRRARQLGLHDTQFKNSRGMPAPGLYMSARDLAALARYAMRDARFRSFVDIATAIVRWPPHHAVTVHNHNRLLRQPWANGIKTGATKSSGMVLVGSGQPKSVPLIVVTMHEPSRAQEVKDALALFAWGSAR